VKVWRKDGEASMVWTGSQSEADTVKQNGYTQVMVEMFDKLALQPSPTGAGAGAGAGASAAGTATGGIPGGAGGDSHQQQSAAVDAPRVVVSSVLPAFAAKRKDAQRRNRCIYVSFHWAAHWYLH
jgi:hypothetical protein